SLGIAIFVGVESLVLYLWLIPRHGALGDAIATLVALTTYNVLKQWGLRNTAGIGLFDRSLVRIYGLIAASAAVLLLAVVLLDLPLVPGVVLAAVASLVVLRAGQRELDVTRTFPELARMPVLGRLM